MNTSGPRLYRYREITNLLACITSRSKVNYMWFQKNWARITVNGPVADMIDHV
jgi:hypothetical protein